MYHFKVVIRVRFAAKNIVDYPVWIGMADTPCQARSIALAASLWGGDVVSCKLLK
jgi:hypothetical protein